MNTIKNYKMRVWLLREELTILDYELYPTMTREEWKTRREEIEAVLFALFKTHPNIDY